ncbi:MAG: hypothetical protein Q9166_003181 [cf. Caloplaca sp. 2 TL-2023]
MTLPKRPSKVKFTMESSQSGKDENEVTMKDFRGSQGSDDQSVQNMAKVLKASTKRRRNARRGKIEKDYHVEMEQLETSVTANLTSISTQVSVNCRTGIARLETLMNLLERRASIEQGIVQSTGERRSHSEYLTNDDKPFLTSINSQDGLTAMSLRVFLQENPRVIILASEHHALIFRCTPPTVVAGLDGTSRIPLGQASAAKSVVESAALESLNLSGYRSLQASGIHGTLGLINIGTDVFLCVISAAIRVATVRPGENVQRILGAEFYCLNRSDYDSQFFDGTDPYLAQSVSPDEQAYGYGYDSQESTVDHPCVELKKILSGGTFYYSVDFDLTNRLQDRLSEGSAFDIDSLDEDFLWNAYMIDPLIKFRSRLSYDERRILDESRMLTSAIRGFVLTVTISAAASPLRSLKSNFPSNLTVLSRLSCRRAGTRFNSRGIDDDGYVANFVESETVLWHPSGLCLSYAQIRGSVPIFWEQATGLLPNQQKIQIARSSEATQPAFDKHFERLELAYGTVHILNLMSTTKMGEVELTARYQHHIQHSPLNQTIGFEGLSKQRLIQSQFDFHAETKGPGGYEAASMVRKLIQDRADSFAYFLCDNIDASKATHGHLEQAGKEQSTVILQQQGVFRVNCLDCLDRTNLIQTILSQMAIELFLSQHSERATADFWMRHSSIWADNGDALSKIYAGTGALKSSFTRHGKMSLAGAIADARKSATRMYINNFADKGRQNTVDMLLGRLVEQQPVYLYDPVNDSVKSELQGRAAEFSTSEKINIWAGTFNLNGRGSGIKEDLSAWLCPRLGHQKRQPEIVAVGFQEIVELSPQQIMSTDPSRRQVWEEAVRLTINKKTKETAQEDYVLLRTGQLVGAALIVFVKSSSLKKIKNVEGSVKKVSGHASLFQAMRHLRGIDRHVWNGGQQRGCGNPDGLRKHSHSGFANYEERNRDYRTISHGLRFQRNRSIDDHDTIIWLGDFNYRIGLSDDKVRRLIAAGDLGTLYQNDQLNLQMIAGHAFPFYSESQISFMPTYKYNNGTDEYDTSEKARIPAWCDRILRKGNNLKQIEYTTAPLRFSDHRPVYATFECTIESIDEKRKEQLAQSLYERRRRNTAASAANDNEKTNEDHASYMSVIAGLPPASSDRRKWWLDNGLPARSQVEPPRNEMILNPLRPSNPFAAANEPDWIMVARPLKIERSERRTSTPPTPPSRRGTRRVPSPSAIQPGVLRTVSASDIDNDALTLPSPSRSSTASNVRRKPAPPIPKKPPLLSTSKSVGTGNYLRNGAIDTNIYPYNNHIDTSVAPPPPRRTGSGTPKPVDELPVSTSKPSSSVRQNNRWQQPSPAIDPRSLLFLSSNRDERTSGGNLLDEDDEGAGAIPSLQPLRPA